MRLDKFLKVSRVIKRRTVAQEACEGGRVSVNGKNAKPAHTLKVGDTVEIRFGDKTVAFEVLALREHVGKDEADSLFRILSGGSD